jgi:putative tryptophan/tyrosine transport system substrate-binding protein
MRQPDCSATGHRPAAAIDAALALAEGGSLMLDVQRREFITLLGGAAAAWPLGATAQRPAKMRRVGVLVTLTDDDSEGKARVAAFRQALQELGWVDGRNLQVEVRWSAGDVARIRKNAADLAALAPDVIVATGNSTIAPLLQATRTVPVVFVTAADPVGAGYVDSLARPSGNATGFLAFDYSISAKWLELLKEITPGLTRVGVIRNPEIPAAIGQFAVIQSAAGSLGVEVSALNVHAISDLDSVIASFTRGTNGGLIVTASVLALSGRNQIIALAAKHKLPTAYYGRHFVTAGGLISYGPNWVDQYRLAAGYVDRIFKGEKPGDLPVQAPTKYELVINLKTAKALGLTVPPSLLARADEVIE